MHGVLIGIISHDYAGEGTHRIGHFGIDDVVIDAEEEFAFCGYTELHRFLSVGMGEEYSRLAYRSRVHHQVDREGCVLEAARHIGCGITLLAAVEMQ